MLCCLLQQNQQFYVLTSLNTFCLLWKSRRISTWIYTCKNCLFGMYHSRTPEHNKHVIQQSLLSETGTVCVIFFTNALGTGVNMASINNHYGEPRSIEDYFQECGCAGHIGDQTYSTIFYKPSNCPLYEHPNTVHEYETNAVQHYVKEAVQWELVHTNSYPCPFVRTQHHKSYFKYSLIPIWNSLPESTTSATSHLLLNSD